MTLWLFSNILILQLSTFSDYHLIKPNQLIPGVYVGDEPVYDAVRGENIYGLFLDGTLDIGWIGDRDLGRYVSSRLSKVP